MNFRVRVLVKSAVNGLVCSEEKKIAYSQNDSLLFPYARSLGYMLWLNFILGLNFIPFWFWTCSVKVAMSLKLKKIKFKVLFKKRAGVYYQV